MKIMLGMAMMFNLAGAFVQLSLYVKERTGEHADNYRLLLGYAAACTAGLLLALLLEKP